MIRHAWIVLTIALVVSPNISAAAEARARPHPVGHPSSVEGTASWYGWRQHGRRMADGQPFHALGSAAASPVLPLGSRVKVTNLTNHRAAWVTIQDREPATRGRVVDVSLGTARALGMEKQGLTKVRLEVSKERAAGSDHARAASRRRAYHATRGAHGVTDHHGRRDADLLSHTRAEAGPGVRRHRVRQRNPKSAGHMSS
jgi:rare lipoprotein A (peptidoglycan hydrolase)